MLPGERRRKDPFAADSPLSLDRVEVSAYRERMNPVFTAARFLLLAIFVPTVAADGPVTPNPDYVVITSDRCRGTDGWSQVAGALAAKHAADLLVFKESPEELLPELRLRHPRMIGVVAMPDEAGRARMGELHRMLRRLDEDPYLDVRWGVVTATAWPAAMEIVRAERPLRVSTMLSNTPVPLEVVPDGVYFDEGVAGRRVERTQGEAEEEILGDTATADDFASAFNRLQPDLLVTSGRTNEERWMIGYTFDGGRVIVGEDGFLRARTPDGVETPLASSGPMAMLGAGSCLLGYVPNMKVLPLRFIEQAGARQVVGYCSTTWYGAGGWDLYRRFLEEPGRHSLAEATWLAQQDLVRRFDAEFPGKPEVSTAGFDERAVPEFRAEVTARTGMPRTDERFDDLSGLLWDRDALVLLGDPAWRVELEDRDLPWSVERRREGDRLLLEVTVHEDLEDKATPAVILGQRVHPGRVIDGAGTEPVLLDDLVFMPGLVDVAVGESVVVELEAPLARPTASEAGPTPVEIETALAELELEDDIADRMRSVIALAGSNGGELIRAMVEVPASRLASMGHLVANLPPRDARELPADFLLDQVRLAHESFEGSPWRIGVPEEAFLESVLPHAHIDERRDDWRADFTRRFRDVAWAAGSQEEAVRLLNREVFAAFGIEFDANKRLTNEQSPYQTIVQKCASCTGMSIMLANACRAAGIPARLAGIPEWPTGDNHTWVEVFDPTDGLWHWIEAYGSSGYDEGWWVEKVRNLALAADEDPRFRPWAVMWSRPEGVPDRMRLWWLADDDDPIPAIDRSSAYAEARDGS